MIVVTGATGNVGRSLVSQLVAEGQPVRGLTRDPDRAALPAGAEAVRADFADPAALAALFAGATGLFINLSAVGEHTPVVLAAAIPAGVRRVVMLSSDAVDDDPDEANPLVAHHIAPERAVMASGSQWTLLRPNGFAVNSFQWAPQIRAGDVVRAPFAGARSAPIHEADIAAVAVRALVDDGHHTAIYLLTGPEAFSNAEQVGIIGAALGRDLRYEEIPRRAGQAGAVPARAAGVARHGPGRAGRRGGRGARGVHGGRRGHRPPGADLRPMGGRPHGGLHPPHGLTRPSSGPRRLRPSAPASLAPAPRPRPHLGSGARGCRAPCPSAACPTRARPTRARPRRRQRAGPAPPPAAVASPRAAPRGRAPEPAEGA